jgi:hypothetical protein
MAVDLRTGQTGSLGTGAGPKRPSRQRLYAAWSFSGRSRLTKIGSFGQIESASPVHGSVTKNQRPKSRTSIGADPSDLQPESPSRFQRRAAGEKLVQPDTLVACRSLSVPIAGLRRHVHLRRSRLSRPAGAAFACQVRRGEGNLHIVCGPACGASRTSLVAAAVDSHRCAADCARQTVYGRSSRCHLTR